MSDESGGSEPCFAHLLIDGQPVDAQTARDVARFRRAERARLMALRRATPQAENAAMAEVVSQGLDRIIGSPAQRRIAVYWPIRGELDLRGWMARAHEAGARVLLPVVVGKAQPLEFRPWYPGCAMARGVWDIPVPIEGADLRPDIVIAPLLGVDQALYRLGNGGGYYDRTLARLPDPPRVIGVGQGFARMKTIFPMPWDVAMQTVVLGDGAVLGHDAKGEAMERGGS